MDEGKTREGKRADSLDIGMLVTFLDDTPLSYFIGTTPCIDM